jgi:hypothetical protein
VQYRPVLVPGTVHLCVWSREGALSNEKAPQAAPKKLLDLRGVMRTMSSSIKQHREAKVPGVRTRLSAWRVTLVLPFQSWRASLNRGLHCYRIGWAGS